MDLLSSSTTANRVLSANEISPIYPALSPLQTTPVRPASSLVFIDSAVVDGQLLAASMSAGSEVHFLDPTQSAIAQITNTLLGQKNIASVQVLSHGAAGGLQFGHDWLNLNNVQSYTTQLQSWQGALTHDADILLYGCNVAQGEMGKAFVQILSQLTQADVAASNDLTGNPALGGDWELEVNTGAIDALSALQLSITAYGSVLDATYHNLASGAFTQDWSNTGLITGNDDWSGVPSIIGYLGQDLTIATGTDPQTILTANSAVANDLDIIANQVNPNTLTTGGIAEFDGIANPTVALQGSGTADAPYLLIHLNTTGVTDPISVSYNLRDIDGSTDNAIQPIALQYRVGTTGNFTNIPTAYVADASSGPSLASLVTPVNVTLPAAVNNQAQVQLRVMTTNAAGIDEWIGIDDIQIAATVASLPTVSLTAPTATASEGGSNGIYSLARTNSTAAPLTVKLTIGSSTISSSDYTLTAGTGLTIDSIIGNTITATLAAGTTTADLTLAAVDDIHAEADEALLLSIATDSGYSIDASNNAGTVTIAQNDFVVINTSDSGEGSLRQAIANANAIAGTDTVTFAGSTFTDAIPDTIILTGGELSITGNTTITGTGASLLTLSGNNASRIFNVASGTIVSLAGLAIANGRSDAGGGIINAGNLTILNSVIQNNVINATGSNPDGGGIYNQNTGTLSLQNSTVRNNTAADDGGGIRNDGNLQVLNSTISGNTSSGTSSTSGGGGIINVQGATATITSSTISGNTARNAGGIRNDGTLSLQNVTITANTASLGDVGGVANTTGVTSLRNTIIAGNIDTVTSPNNLPDVGVIFANTFIDNGNNLIGASNGFNSIFNPSTLRGTVASPLNPLLSVLGDSGGTTQTHALLPGSGAIDAASNGTPTDQRGIAAVGSRDIGAFEYVPSTVSLSTSTPSISEGDSGSFTIDRGTDTLGDLTVNLTTTGSSTDLTSSDYTLNVGGTPVTVSNGTLSVVIPNGQTSVSLNMAALQEALGFAEGAETLQLNLASGLYYTLGSNNTASITIAANDFVVTTTNDSGEGSLRQAILNANAIAGDDTITFVDSTFTDATPDTITLTSGELGISSNLTIQGTGSNLLTVSGNDASRVFNISGGTAIMDGLTIANGNAGAANGGGIFNGGSLTLTNSIVRNNRTANSAASQNGGGIYTQGSLTLTDSTILNNTGYLGGGLFSSGAAVLTNVIASGNTASEGGGINSNNGSVMTLTNSTVSGNTSTSNGGGVMNLGTSNLTITNSTISGNTGANGGGIRNTQGATLTITNLTIANNTAIAGGGGISSDTGTVNVKNTLIAGNTYASSPDVSGTFVNQGNNLIGKSNGSTSFTNGVNGNLVGTIAAPIDPQLGALANNGGPTQTHALLAGSLAINAGSNTGVTTTDQMGNPRIVNSLVDIGAVESPFDRVSLTATDATATELSGNTGTYRIQRDNPVGDLVVNLTIANSSTASAADYTFSNNGSVSGSTLTVTIPDGQSFVDVSLTPILDAIAEGTETLTLTLASGSYGINATQTTASVDITDAPVVSVTAQDATATELPGNSGTFRITRTGDSTQALTVNYAIGGTATSGTDYTALTGTATITAGQSFVDIILDPMNDSTVEGTETAVLTLASGDYAISATNSATVDIIDVPVVTVSVPDASASESTPNSGSFRLTRTGDTSQNLVVNYTIAGTATNGTDYATLTGTATIAAGQSFVDVLVDPINDAIAEGDETIQLTLTTGDYNLDSNSSGEVTILANDPTIPIQPINISQSEGNSGTSSYAFTVELSNASDEVVTVDYATVNGSATTADNDYIAKTGTLTFNPGDPLTQTITVDVIGDTKYEADQTFAVNLSNAGNGAISVATASGTILNDDAQPTISINPVTPGLLEGNTGTRSYDFVVALSNASDEVVTVNYNTLNGSATAGSDYVAIDPTQLTFQPGDPLTQTIQVMVNGDSEFESNETFSVTLSGVTNGSISPADPTATGTIANDDGLSIYDFSSTNFVTLEGNTTYTSDVVTITRSNNINVASAIDVAMTAGTATDGSDFVSRTVLVNFAAGQTVATVPVDILGDTRAEADETLGLTLVNPVSTGILGAQSQTTLIIANDDAVPIYNFSTSNYRVLEGDGFQIVPLAITRSDNLTRDSLVQVQLSNGSAIAGQDFVGGVITINFAVGQAIAYLPIQLMGNSQYEADKTLNLSFVGFSEEGGYGYQAYSSLTIVNDDTLFQRGSGRSGMKIR